MKLDRKMIKSVGLALSLPSLIFFTAIAAKKIVDAGILSKGIAIVIFLLVISNTIFLMVYYGFKNKN